MAYDNSLKTGALGGQTIYGGTGASENLTIESTSNATKGNVLLNPSGGNVGIGTGSPSSQLHITKANSTGETDLLINPTVKISGNLIDAQIDGVSKFKVSDMGATTMTYAVVTSYINSPRIYSSGVLRLADTASSVAKTLVSLGNNTAIMTNPSGSSTALSILSNYNQTSSTASNTDFLINRTETAVGSGTQRLIDAQVGGISKFNVDNTGLVTINTNKINITTAKTPASEADTGNTGDIAWDTNYIYVCVATNTWKRATLLGGW